MLRYDLMRFFNASIINLLKNKYLYCVRLIIAVDPSGKLRLKPSNKCYSSDNFLEFDEYPSRRNDDEDITFWWNQWGAPRVDITIFVIKKNTKFYFPRLFDKNSEEMYFLLGSDYRIFEYDGIYYASSSNTGLVYQIKIINDIHQIINNIQLLQTCGEENLVTKKVLDGSDINVPITKIGNKDETIPIDNNNNKLTNKSCWVYINWFVKKGIKYTKVYRNKKKDFIIPYKNQNNMFKGSGSSKYFTKVDELKFNDYQNINDGVTPAMSFTSPHIDILYNGKKSKLGVVIVKFQWINMININLILIYIILEKI